MTNITRKMKIWLLFGLLTGSAVLAQPSYAGDGPAPLPPTIPPPGGGVAQVNYIGDLPAPLPPTVPPANFGLVLG